MFFKFVGIIVCIVVVLTLLGGLINERQQNQPPTVIQAPAAEADSNIRKYLTEQPNHNAVAPPPKDTGGYQSRCLEEWTKRGVINQEMVNYCISVEREGYAKLVTLLRQYGGYSWMQGVLEKNISEWTKRGARVDSQVAYGVGREVDAFLNLKYAAEHSPGIQEATANNCLEEWSANSIQWTQVEYCYKGRRGEN